VKCHSGTASGTGVSHLKTAKNHHFVQAGAVKIVQDSIAILLKRNGGFTSNPQLRNYNPTRQTILALFG
jgi:hypothetical protein